MTRRRSPIKNSKGVQEETLIARENPVRAIHPQSQLRQTLRLASRHKHKRRPMGIKNHMGSRSRLQSRFFCISYRCRLDDTRQSPARAPDQTTGGLNQRFFLHFFRIFCIKIRRANDARRGFGFFRERVESC